MSTGIAHLFRPDGNIRLADGRRYMCWRLRVMAARKRVPKPSVYRFWGYNAWHYGLPSQRPSPGTFDFDRAPDYIEVIWS